MRVSGVHKLGSLCGYSPMLSIEGYGLAPINAVKLAITLLIHLIYYGLANLTATIIMNLLGSIYFSEGPNECYSGP